MAGHAADLLPVFPIAMNNGNTQPQGPQYTIITTQSSALEVILFNCFSLHMNRFNLFTPSLAAMLVF